MKIQHIFIQLLGLSPFFKFQLGMPLACDVFSALDTFLLTLPMFILTALAIHMFTRFPSPQFSDPSHPHNRQEIKVYGGRISGNKYTPALNTRLVILIILSNI